MNTLLTVVTPDENWSDLTFEPIDVDPEDIRLPEDEQLRLCKRELPFIRLALILLSRDDNTSMAKLLSDLDKDGFDAVMDALDDFVLIRDRHKSLSELMGAAIARVCIAGEQAFPEPAEGGAS